LSLIPQGKGARNGYPQPGEDEELHAMIMGESEERVLAAVKLINSIIEESCSIPEGQNELKRQQLRELALLNGTLRDDEGQICHRYVFMRVTESNGFITLFYQSKRFLLLLIH
jgi:splicing factor 1